MKLKDKTLFVISAIMSVIIISQFNAFAEETTKKEKSETTQIGAKEIEDRKGWRVRDFRPYIQAIKDLEKMSSEYSDNMLKLAVDEYSTGLDILEDMEHEISKMTSANKGKKNLNERWYWQEIDRRNKEQRQIARKKYSAKMKSITYFTKAIKYLDDIQNLETRKSPEYINFQSKLYQIYVSTQYDLKNIKPCIPILERYLTLSEKNKQNVWAYKYLASSYGYMEAILTKYKHSTEDEIQKFRNKKNRSMLQAVELKFGTKSSEFKRIQEIVELNEKKSERINSFK